MFTSTTFILVLSVHLDSALVCAMNLNYIQLVLICLI